MSHSNVPADLIEAYEAADYHVDTAPYPIRFRIRQYTPALARLLTDAGQESAFFVTAYNPFSQPQDETANRAAHRRLWRRLADVTSHLFEARGTDPSGEWPPELGYLALGVPLADAEAVGREFRQNAIVWIDGDALPQLVLLR